jgi:type IV secretion system protein TrbC
MGVIKLTATLSEPPFIRPKTMPQRRSNTGPPLTSCARRISIPTKIVAVIIIIVTGLTLAFGDTAGGFRRLIQIVFGLSIAFAASSFFLSFFSFGGGALI